MPWTKLAAKAAAGVALRREAKRFVRHNHPDADNFGFTAFVCVGSVRHGRERTDGHTYVHGVGTVLGTGLQDFVAFHRAVIPFGPPVGEKILFRIARTGIPELVRSVGIAGYERVEEM